jgi:hypothetical protein
MLVKVFQLDEELGNQEIDDNFLYFKNVSERDFQVVDEKRSPRGRHMKLCYVSEIRFLIVRICTGPSEFATREFEFMFRMKFKNMGVTALELGSIGSTTIEWKTSTATVSIEGDCAYVNRNLRSLLDPHFVEEIAVSQTMQSLHSNAALWIGSGRVNLVLLIMIDKVTLEMFMEKWIPIPESQEESSQNVRGQRIVEQTIIDLETLEIRGDVPLTLEFERVVGRPHNLPLEKDSKCFANTI